VDVADLVRAVTRRSFPWIALAALLAAAALAREEPKPVIAFEARDVSALRADWYAEHGADPTDRELRVLIERAIDEEVLVREALRVGLHRADPLVKRRIVQMAQDVTGTRDVDWAFAQRTLDEDAWVGDPVVRARLVDAMARCLRAQVRDRDVDDAALADYLAVHPGAFATPETLRFTHVYVGDDDAATVRATVASLGPDEAPVVGKAFLHPPEQGPITHREIAKRFGPGFADAIHGLEAGRWHGPVASAYGDHFVWVHERRTGKVPPLSAVRAQVERAVRAGLETEALRDGIARLRTRYRVEIEGTPA